MKKDILATAMFGYQDDKKETIKAPTSEEIKPADALSKNDPITENTQAPQNEAVQAPPVVAPFVSTTVASESNGKRHRYTKPAEYKRSARFELTLVPSLKDSVYYYAELYGISANEYINQAIEAKILADKRAFKK